MRGRAGESGERGSCASRAGYFRGFHHDALERSKIAVVLSTNPAFKLKASVGSEPRIRMKSEGKPRSWRIAFFFFFWKRERRRCCAVFSSEVLGRITPVVRAPSVLFPGLSPPPHLRRDLCHYFPTHAGDLRGALSSVPSVSQFVGGKCAR